MSVEPPASPDLAEQAEQTDNLDESAKKRMRFAPRTNLACTQCRRRKTRCSGGWPSCDGCLTRHEDCVYEGVRAQISSRPNPQQRQERTIGVIPTPAASRAPAPATGERDLRLPNEEWRRKAISHFREHYTLTLLCFIPPQDLIRDDAGQNLPRPLMLSMLALVSRFIPEFTQAGSDPLVISNTFADATRLELVHEYNKPTLSTVQACLILAIFEVGNGEENQGWLRLGHAIRLAQLLKLHKLDADEPAFRGSLTHQPDSPTLLESKRRTFWCAFCLDRLLANGRDRLAVLRIENISTRLPQPDEDFIYGKKNACLRLRDNVEEISDSSTVTESLFTQTIRIVNILGDIQSWHGNGGRFADSTSPWLADMPFTILDRSLQQWRKSLPQHLDYSHSTIPLIIAAGQGRAWAFMFLLFHQARALLHREYLPFTSPKDYDPSKGPCDGPALTPEDRRPSTAWWLNSATKMIESANAVSDIYTLMKNKNLSATAYPFPGFSLLVAASIHIQCKINNWPIMHDLTMNSATFLQRDLEACHSLGLKWPLINHWIHQLTLYYEINLRTKRLGTPPGDDLVESLNISEVRNDIINYIRNMPPDKKRPKLPRSEFDFDGWVSILDSAANGQQIKRRNSESPPPRQFEAVNSSSGTSPAIAAGLDRGALTKGGMFDDAWWDSWDVEDWDPEIFRLVEAERNTHISGDIRARLDPQRNRLNCRHLQDTVVCHPLGGSRNGMLHNLHQTCPIFRLVCGGVLLHDQSRLSAMTLREPAREIPHDDLTNERHFEISLRALGRGDLMPVVG